MSKLPAGAAGTWQHALPPLSPWPQLLSCSRGREVLPVSPAANNNKLSDHLTSHSLSTADSVPAGKSLVPYKLLRKKAEPAAGTPTRGALATRVSSLRSDTILCLSVPCSG